VTLIKERVDEQVGPIAQHLADIASSPGTRQIGALIKREVDEYYEQLSFVKKIFISRERIYREVDDLVYKHFAAANRRVFARAAFVQEATSSDR